MTKKFIRFLVRVSLFSLILIAIAIALYWLLPPATLPRILPWLFVMFFTLTIAVHFILLKIARLRPARFVNYFMLTTFAKLIIYFIFILAYVFGTKTGILSFILTFFILYILYTVFEVVMILNQTDKEKGN